VSARTLELDVLPIDADQLRRDLFAGACDAAELQAAPVARRSGLERRKHLTFAQALAHVRGVTIDPAGGRTR